jgi:hypothetical protein
MFMHHILGLQEKQWRRDGRSSDGLLPGEEYLEQGARDSTKPKPKASNQTDDGDDGNGDENDDRASAASEASSNSSTDSYSDTDTESDPGSDAEDGEGGDDARRRFAADKAQRALRDAAKRVARKRAARNNSTSTMLLYSRSRGGYRLLQHEQLSGLTTLVICHNRIGAAGGVALGAVLKHSKRLTSLHASANRIGNKGAIAIAHALGGGSKYEYQHPPPLFAAAAHNTNNSNSNNKRPDSGQKSDGSAAAWQPAACRCPPNNTLVELNLGTNGVGYDGGCALAQVLGSRYTS